MGVRIGFGGGYGQYGVRGVGLGFSGPHQNEFAGQSESQVNMSGAGGFVEFIPNGGPPIVIYSYYGEGSAVNNFEIPVRQEPFGALYTRQSPSGTSGVDLREKGGKYGTGVKLRRVAAGGEISIFDRPPLDRFESRRYVFTHFNFDRLERENVATTAAEAIFFGKTVSFGQQQVFELVETRVGAGIGAGLEVPLGSRFNFKSTARGGLYYRTGALVSNEHITGNATPPFTLKIEDTDNGVGFDGEFGAAIEFRLSSQLSLSAGGSVSYLSTLSGIDNPGSSKEINEGRTTRIGTSDAFWTALKLNLIMHFGER